jgi:predicted metalloprotease with PDZ domain
VFLIHDGAGLSGGTEHLNSTIMQTSRAAITGSVGGRGAYQRFLSLVAHEMFHTWNVKRLRPADLKPYDYQRGNYSRLLWVAEGTTSYYGALVLVRAGFSDVDSYVGGIAGMIEGQMNLAAWDEQSVEEASLDSWIRFGKTWPDSVNTGVSFYSKGSLVSLLLDMELRTRSRNRVSLDTLMKRMYEEFPLEGPGYTTADMARIAGELTGTYFGQFFRDYVSGTARPDFAAALSVVGLEVTSEGREEEAYLGVNLIERDGKTSVASVLIDGPAYQAGVMADDEVLSLDGEELGAVDLDDRLEKRKPGERVAFELRRRGEKRTVQVVLAPNPHRRWHVKRAEHPTDAQRAAFESWVGRGE